MDLSVSERWLETIVHTRRVPSEYTLAVMVAEEVPINNTNCPSVHTRTQGTYLKWARPGAAACTLSSDTH